jgi:hypothetical protein
MKSIKELLKNKLDKLTWIQWDGSGITSKEGFVVWVDYIENIGKNKDTNQLLINITYKGQPVLTSATTDKDTMEYFGVWYMELGDSINEQNDKRDKEVEKEGKLKFEKL